MSASTLCPTTIIVQSSTLSCASRHALPHRAARAVPAVQSQPLRPLANLLLPTAAVDAGAARFIKLAVMIMYRLQIGSRLNSFFQLVNNTLKEVNG